MKTELSPNMIIKTVAEYYHLETDELICKKRFGEYVKARHIAMYFSRKYTFLSYAAIGKYFGKDHATVYFATNSVRDQSKYYDKYWKQVNEIEEQIKKKIENIEYENLEYEYEVFQENDFYN